MSYTSSALSLHLHIYKKLPKFQHKSRTKMSKQTSKTIRKHIGWSAVFVALLFVLINAMPRALGQRHISNRNLAFQAPRVSNINGAAPAAATMPNLRAAASPAGRRRGPEGV